MKTLILLRHCSGSGSSTLAQLLVASLKCEARHYEADMWMIENGEYKFHPSKLGFAHNSCRLATENDMIKEIPIIIVSNTFTKESELNPYLELADKNNYRVVSLIVEHRHDGQNLHNVPDVALIRQENAIKSNLKLL